MLTLAEAALIEEDPLRRGVMETIHLETAFLSLVPFYEIEGSAYSYNLEDTLPGVEYRAVNSAYAESTGTYNNASESIVIAGGEADVDTFIQRTQSNLNDQRALQERAKAKAMGFQFQDSFINGSVVRDANEFDGLNRRLVGDQVLTPSTHSGDYIEIMGTTDEDRHAFLDYLDELLALVPGINGSNGLIVMSSRAQAKFSSSLRRLTMATTTADQLGRQFDSYRGIPFVDAGTNPWTGDPIVSETEPSGGGAPTNDTTSIYAVKFGRTPDDGAVTGLTNGGLQVEDMGKLQSKPAWMTRIEFFHGLGLFGGEAAARGRRVKIS
jgi:hypothetical protein